MFRLRAQALLDTEAAAGLSARLHGLLIGLEFAQALQSRPDWARLAARDGIYLSARPEIALRYERAATAFGLKCTLLDATACYCQALVALEQQLAN